MGLRNALKKTRNKLSKNLRNLIGSRDPYLIDEIEDILIQSDIGISASEELVRVLEKEKPDNYYNRIEEELISILQKKKLADDNSYRKPVVELYVGVNGVGKTTTIGKRAYRLKKEGNGVLLASGDTYRTGAVQQLKKWAEEVDAGLVESQYGADPASVAYDAVDSAIARGVDYILIDTAGRLHTKKNLMEEMSKIKRVLNKKREDLPQETIIVIDATTGQNALEQARKFNEAIGLTGVALAKIDGTAKGGIVVAIVNELGIPVHFLGTGEEKEDLINFDSEEFVKALLE